MLTILWVLGLFAVCVGWGVLMTVAMGDVSPYFQGNAGVAIGTGGSIFAVTAVGAGIVYAMTRSRARALWTWTILVLLVMAFLGIGAAQ